jgi:prepilin-type N-terminal cleavage/methylation domain-containing protein
MKQKLEKFRSQSGFTIIELMVVLSIMATISTVLILDFSSQRTVRNVVLAKNETVTNLRKVQSYTLTSRKINNTNPARFYIVTFERDAWALNTYNTYKVQAVDNDFGFYPNVETFTLPQGITFGEFEIEPASKGTPVGYLCVQIVFSVPYGTMYSMGGDSCDPNIAATLNDPVEIAQLSQRKARINLMANAKDYGYIGINPLTGEIKAY